MSGVDESFNNDQDSTPELRLGALTYRVRRVPAPATGGIQATPEGHAKSKAGRSALMTIARGVFEPLEQALVQVYPEFLGRSVDRSRNWYWGIDPYGQVIGCAGGQHGYRRNPWYVSRDCDALGMARLALAANWLHHGEKAASRSERCLPSNVGSLRMMLALGMGGRIGNHGDVAAKASVTEADLAGRVFLRQQIAASLPAYDQARGRGKAKLAKFPPAVFEPRALHFPEIIATVEVTIEGYDDDA